MRHCRGLAASPRVRYKLKVERGLGPFFYGLFMARFFPMAFERMFD
jgi:hypothetical protein